MNQFSWRFHSYLLPEIRHNNYKHRRYKKKLQCNIIEDFVENVIDTTQICKSKSK